MAIKTTIGQTQATDEKFVYPCLLIHKTTNVVVLAKDAGYGTTLSKGTDDSTYVGEFSKDWSFADCPSHWRLLNKPITLENS